MAGSHTGTHEWQSFEVRMRRRRVERCLLKADVALEAGFGADAREALEEARRLDPHAPELTDLDARITALEQNPGRAPQRRRGRLAVPLIAAALLLAALGTWRYWPRPLEPPLATTPAAPEQVVPAEVGRAPTPERPLLTVATESITATAIRPELSPLADTAAEGSGHPDAVVAVSSPAPILAPEPTLPRFEPRTFARAAPPTLPPPADPPRAELPPDTRAVDPVNTLPVEPVPSPAPSRDADAAAAVAAPREDERVRAVLARYEAAYSMLDAGAAGVVYPRIDRAALARAFDGLSAQRVSLGSCTVVVAGPAANATCSGSATWTPKVGGGTRTEARQWRFELRQSDAGWQIMEARVR